MNPVLVHSCFSAREPKKIGSGAKMIFHSNPNKSCTCSFRVSYSDRDLKLERGEAYVVIRKNMLDHEVPEWREIVLVDKQNRLPVASTISDMHIESAYVENVDYHQERIECYGTMTQEMFCRMGASDLPETELYAYQRVVAGR